MKFKQFIVFLFLGFGLFALAGCNEQVSYEGKTKIIYELEGGSYQDCKLPVIQYYSFEGESGLIIEPSALSQKEILRPGYHIEGWYQTKNTDGSFSNPWDFKKDYAPKEGLTLYAAWAKNNHFTYTVCYYDKDDAVQTLGSYDVKEGDTFDDYLSYSKKRKGDDESASYTPIRYLDESKNAWDESFTHPGGEGEVDVKVFVEYIKGTYSVVTNADELRKYKGNNIYLANDIDLGGIAFSFKDYNKSFLGNGHTISNFTINYSAGKNDLLADLTDTSRKSAYISIFGNVKDATIQDVSFTNVSVTVNAGYPTTYKIYLSPIAITMTNSNIQNVSFEGKYEINTTPTDFDFENFIVENNQAYVTIDSKSKVENTVVKLEEMTKEGE